MRSHVISISILALVCICASCGGGGGGGDESSGDMVDTSQALALTSSNAPAVSGFAVAAAGAGITVGSFGTVGIASADSPPGSSFEFNLLHVTQDVVDRIWAMGQQETLAAMDISAAQVPSQVDCAGGGAVDTIWKDVDSDGELSEGDGITLIFGNCVEEDLTLNGEITVGILRVVGDPLINPAWTALFRLNFDSLTASEDGVIAEIAGTLDVTVDTQVSGLVVTGITTEVATGPGTTASSFLYFGEGNEFTELTLYSVSFQEDTDGSFAVSSQGTLESSFIGGTVTFETTQEITGTDFEINYPSAGEMLIVGAANSNVLLRILDSVFVELDVDDEGDGFDTGDVTLPSSWDDLDDAVDAL